MMNEDGFKDIFDLVSHPELDAEVDAMFATLMADFDRLCAPSFDLMPTAAQSCEDSTEFRAALAEALKSLGPSKRKFKLIAGRANLAA